MCCVCGGGETAWVEPVVPETPVTPAADEMCVDTDTDTGAKPFFLSYGCSGWTESMCGIYTNNYFNSNVMCCVCGGGEISAATGCEANEKTKSDAYGDYCYEYWGTNWCGNEAYNTPDFDSNRDCCACQ